MIEDTEVLIVLSADENRKGTNGLAETKHPQSLVESTSGVNTLTVMK